MICFGQYDVRKCDMSISLKNACATDLALLHSDTAVTHAWASLLNGKTGGTQDGCGWQWLQHKLLLLKRDLPAFKPKIFAESKVKGWLLFLPMTETLEPR